MSPEKSVRFGKYLLLDRIGIGGMAEVFKAKLFGAEGFERLIAIKRILPHLVEDDDFVKMFVDEAKIAVRLNHPNIVGIQDLGKAEGTLYIAMEYVLGKDLRAVYDLGKERDEHVPIGIACHIVMKMCEALHHAHFAQGPQGEPLQVIHRDVSPQNVLVSFDGEVKVADFGLAKARGRMVQTQAGVVKGKLAYMSPEQLRGDEIDHRVDVFGLGIVLFELLSGQRLFLGPSDMDTLRRVYEAKVPPIQPLNPDVPPQLEAIIGRALTKDRDQRYGTALELHDDLQQFVYAHGVYAGAASLRRFMRTAFPQTAPSEQAPPFAAAPPEPRATLRPKAKRESHEELVPPPAPIPVESGVLEAQLDAQLDAELDEVIDVDVELDGVQIVDERPTDRPPPMEADVASSAPQLSPAAPGVPNQAVTRQVVAPREDESRKVASRSLPELPEGVYEDEFTTEDLDAVGAPFDAGPDTNPAPAPAPGQARATEEPLAPAAPDLVPFAEDEWDEKTIHSPLTLPLDEEDERTSDEDWPPPKKAADPHGSG